MKDRTGRVGSTQGAGRIAGATAVLPCALALALLGAAAGAAAADPGPAESAPAIAPAPSAGTPSATDAYAEFRREYDAGRYLEAIPPAQKVLQLAEREAKSPTDESVQVALMNLGMVQNLADDYVGAEATYLRVIKLINDSGKPRQERLARAYASLASAYHDGKRHDLAVANFDQAIKLVRRHEGLLTERQVPLINKYIDSLTELGRYQEALQAQKYVLRIAVRQYGPDSVELAPTLEEIGRWYASIGAYDQSRRTLKQALDIVQAKEGPDSRRLVGPLLALAACDRRQLLDPTQQQLAAPDADRGAMFHEAGDMMPAPSMSPSTMASEGERALLRAAEIVDQPPVAPLDVLNVRTQLGDWYQLRNAPERALPQYQIAWHAAQQAPGKYQGKSYAEAIFGEPVLLHYVRPDRWNRYAERPPAEVEVRNVLVEFEVNAQGRVEAPQVIDDSGDVKRGERTAGALQGSARYRPRFAAGEPVPTAGVRYSQPWILLLPPPEPAQPAAAGSPPDAQAARQR